MKIAVLPCDAIGPEITQATVSVLSAANEKFGLGLQFDEQTVGRAALKAHGTTVPQSAIDAVATAD